MLFPRTPKDVDPRRSTFLKRKGPSLGRFFPKVGTGERKNPWVISISYAKSLIVDRTPPTGWGMKSTGCAPISTGLPVFSTDSLSGSTLYLSLLIIDKEEERRETRRVKQQTLIHGFLQLLKKASTGYGWSSTGFGGNPWMVFLLLINNLSIICSPSTDPRVEMRVGTQEIVNG